MKVSIRKILYTGAKKQFRSCNLLYGLMHAFVNVQREILCFSQQSLFFRNTTSKNMTQNCLRRICMSQNLQYLWSLQGILLKQRLSVMSPMGYKFKLLIFHTVNEELNWHTYSNYRIYGHKNVIFRIPFSLLILSGKLCTSITFKFQISARRKILVWKKIFKNMNVWVLH